MIYWLLPNPAGTYTPTPAPGWRAFHVSRQARLFYGLEEDFFRSTGNVIFARLEDAYRFAEKLNARRDILRFPEKAAYASELHALGLWDELAHYLIDLYQKKVDPHVLEEAYHHLVKTLGREKVDTLLRQFVEHFPPLPVFRQEVSPEAYLEQTSEGLPHRLLVLEELILLWLENENPAAEKYRDLFDDTPLRRATPYPQALEALRRFFAQRPPLQDKSLVDWLEEPIRKAPHSLQEQVSYLLEQWGPLLPAEYAVALLREKDILEEELRPRPPGPGPGEPETVVPEYPTLIREVWKKAAPELPLEEIEAYTPDRDWMPEVVLLAKNTLVWLYQLSQRYGQPVRHLDDIPDEELDFLAEAGINALWLIGLWERSPASRTIKKLQGMEHAEASAYAIFAYEIAENLGGQAAFERLKARCAARGIRLAADMVANHTALDARWVEAHPDWYIYTEEPPFPSYRYTGPNLSPYPHLDLRIEDHYWDQTDAAVTFRREDLRTHDVRYIYHGNDGTSIPWNDTAQLNHLKEEVREALIAQILEIARHFPIIRFDAAMTLTKYHYQRLWFPEPGTGGAIPSRARFGLTREAFDRLMPREFWRDVVDRVQAEAPDTLLIAEAFWLMEGYFVRTLGMHRVYNSAFMNMLKREENAKFRKLIQNTLEFDPEILKRYVNYMSNPDEETAAIQFGKGEKYFGVCTLMVTLPGLPMFAHGQIEGLTEKYGMEFARPLLEEPPDTALIERHRREIFPLLRRRYLFAEVENFRFYDFEQAPGVVDENVFAFTNRWGNERVLVIYHNHAGATRGKVHRAVPYRDKATDRYLTPTLAEELGLSRAENTFTIFRDHVSGLYYLHKNTHLHRHGMPFSLKSYDHRVFLDIREVVDDEAGTYARLHAQLAGQGVPSLEEAIQSLVFLPLHQAFRRLWHRELLENLTIWAPEDEAFQAWLEEVHPFFRRMLMEAVARYRAEGHAVTLHKGMLEEAFEDFQQRMERLLGLTFPEEDTLPEPLNGILLQEGEHALTYRSAFYGWVLLDLLGTWLHPDDPVTTAQYILEAWGLDRLLRAPLEDLLEPEEVERVRALIRFLLRHIRWYAPFPQKAEHPAYVLMDRLLRDPVTQALVGMHRFDEVLWYRKEGMEAMLTACYLALQWEEAPPEEALDVLRTWAEAHTRSEYRIDTLLTLLQTGPADHAPEATPSVDLERDVQDSGPRGQSEG